MIRRVISTAVMCALMAVPAMADLIQNGSFETATSDPGGGFTGLGTGSTAITDWRVVGTSNPSGDVIDYIGGFWQAADGSRSLDLNGYNSSGGGVEQAIATILGTKYLVTFYMAGNPGAAGLKTMDVSANGTQTQSYSFNNAGQTTTDMGWILKEFSFTADAPSTTLRFVSTIDNLGWGPALDNVSVSAVPIPAAVLLGMLGLSAAGIKLRKFA